ncbi:hypothetical protein [Peterkaempfera sp. SMS 1(5)a]|uniref:hypothetical protein n=1 Tax=Peterkaempfera podocarpi TaxID=3232308 RepID=UPI00366E48D4
MSLFDYAPGSAGASPPEGPQVDPALARLKTTAGRLRRRFVVTNGISAGMLLLVSLTFGDTLADRVAGPLSLGLVLFMVVGTVLAVSSVQYDRGCRAHSDPQAAAWRAQRTVPSGEEGW